MKNPKIMRKIANLEKILPPVAPKSLWIYSSSV